MSAYPVGSQWRLGLPQKPELNGKICRIVDTVPGRDDKVLVTMANGGKQYGVRTKCLSAVPAETVCFAVGTTVVHPDRGKGAVVEVDHQGASEKPWKVRYEDGKACRYALSAMSKLTGANAPGEDGSHMSRRKKGNPMASISISQAATTRDMSSQSAKEQLVTPRGATTPRGSADEGDGLRTSISQHTPRGATTPRGSADEGDARRTPMSQQLSAKTLYNEDPAAALRADARMRAALRAPPKLRADVTPPSSGSVPVNTPRRCPFDYDPRDLQRSSSASQPTTPSAQREPSSPTWPDMEQLRCSSAPGDTGLPRDSKAGFRFMLDDRDEDERPPEYTPPGVLNATKRSAATSRGKSKFGGGGGLSTEIAW